MWPEEDFPYTTVGKMTLNRNPKNFFAENEQMAFAPSNIIPGTPAVLHTLLLISLHGIRCTIRSNQFLSFRIRRAVQTVFAAEQQICTTVRSTASGRSVSD